MSETNQTHSETVTQTQRHLQAMETLERVILSLQARMTNETMVLQTIVDAVVKELGYKGAMVATLENKNALPVRAYALDAAKKAVALIEEKSGLTLLGSKAIVYLDDDKYKDNLSVRAVKGANGRPQKYVTSDHLHDLLRPILNKQLATMAQQMLGINHVIAVPFYLEDDIVGNLFVATREKNFSDWEVSLLTAFGQQAAAGIRNARLYKEAEKQRQIAQIFGRMAFSATASVHTLGNHLSAVYTFIQLLTSLSDFSEDQQDEILSNSSNALARLEKAASLIDTLHEPWQQLSDRPTNVNDCINRSLRKVFPEILQELYDEIMVTEDQITVHMDLLYDLPMVSTSADMLTEAFRVLIKNGAEAIRERNDARRLRIISRVTPDNQLEISIQDSGIGIKTENLSRIFNLGWSTKRNSGMGFGLFWVHDYVQGLNGRINVISTLGEGTTFTLYLPI